MANNGSPQKKTAGKKAVKASPPAAKKVTAKKAAAPVRKTTRVVPPPRATVRAEPQVDAGSVAGAADDHAAVDKRFSDLLAARSRRRQLRALKVVCYALASGFLVSLGLAIWQLMIPSLIAGVYVAMAGVFATATGICATIYFQRKKGDRNED